ncbi:MAG: sigma-70 family RNA polymerase sigma factor [Aureispira sp.]|nr:sigma-70 family RNA polymerase sigma factor [Aureispira sp.]
MNRKEFTYQLLNIKDKLYRFARRIVGREDEAEDVVQEVVIKLWKKHEGGEQYNNLEAYGMRMTKNLSLDKLKSKHKQNQQLETITEPTTSSLNPYQVAEQSDTLGRIHGLMQSLPEKQRMVMQLRDIEGMTYQEIAEVLDIPMNQVKVNLFRARKQIKEQLLNIESYGLSKH